MAPVRLRWWHRTARRLVASRPGAWLSARTAHHLDRPALRLSRGRRSPSLALTGFPAALLTSTGARSGRRHRVPVLPLCDGDRVVLIASNWGQPRHPGWYHNLRAHPEATLALDGVVRRYTAREASAAERARYWPEFVRLFPGYAAYQRRAGRRIPLVVLTPQGPDAGRPSAR